MRRNKYTFKMPSFSQVYFTFIMSLETIINLYSSEIFSRARNCRDRSSRDERIFYEGPKCIMLEAEVSFAGGRSVFSRGAEVF